MLISGLLDKEEPPARAWIESQLRPPRKTSRVAPSQPSGPIVVPQRSHRQLERPGDVEAGAPRVDWAELFGVIGQIQDPGRDAASDDADAMLRQTAARPLRGVDRFFSAGRDYPLVGDGWLMTPLHAAVARGDARLAARLVGRGARVNARTRMSYCSACNTYFIILTGAVMFPLFLPMFVTFVVPCLLANPDWFAKTPLHLAILRGEPDLVDALLALGADRDAPARFHLGVRCCCRRAPREIVRSKWMGADASTPAIADLLDEDALAARLAAERGSMALDVVTLSGEHARVDAEPTDSVVALKLRIAGSQGVARRHQRLMLGDCELRDGTLEEAGVRPGATIKLIVVEPAWAEDV